MEGRKTVRVIRGWQDCRARIPNEPVLMAVPGEWAPAIFSLVKISKTYRDSGLLVTNVGPKREGAKVGIARGDVLLRCNGVELDSAATFRRLVKNVTKDAAASPKLVIEAARGSEDLSFEVSSDALGITVSPLLHRLRQIRVSQPEVGKLAEICGAIPVVRTMEDTQKCEAGKNALVEVPGEIAKKALYLVKTLEATGASKLKKMAKALIATALPH
jgi:hypothetical protein